MILYICYVKHLYSNRLVCFITLKKDFAFGEKTNIAFLSSLFDIKKKTIKCFKDKIDNSLMYINNVCYCWNYFIKLIELNLIFSKNIILITAFETDILHYYNLIICACYFNIYKFYYDY